VRITGVGAATAAVRAGFVFCAGSEVATSASAQPSARQCLIERLIEFGMQES
jgi:hypothetical protein